MDEIEADLLLRRDLSQQLVDFHTQRLTEAQSQLDDTQGALDGYRGALEAVATLTARGVPIVVTP